MEPPDPKPAASNALATDASAPIVHREEVVLFEGGPATLPSVGALLVTILTLGIAALYYAALARTVRYRITSQRVVVERGILSKAMDQTDLFRIVDFVVERPLAQRIMGTGNLVLRVAEKSSSELRIDGIRTDVVALYERVRKAVLVEREHQRVRLVDNE